MVLCYQLGLHDLVVETDSLLVVNWLNQKKKPPWQHIELWYDILSLSSFMNFQIIPSFRKGIGVADGLAKLGADGLDASFSSATQLRKHLYGIFLTDKSGLPSFRHCN